MGNATKRLAILGLAVSMAGCNTESTATPEVTPNGNTRFKVELEAAWLYPNLSVVEIDGCEYLAGQTGSHDNSVLAHKGNCKFCIERGKKSP